MSEHVQPDLFGEYDDEQDRLRAVEEERATWRRRFYVRTEPWTFDTTGAKKGDLHEVFRCPDCGREESTPFALQLNHGWDVDQPGRRGWCSWVRPDSRRGGQRV